MNDPVTGITQTIHSQLGQARTGIGDQHASAGSSFQGVLKGTGHVANQSSGTSGVQLEQMRVDLMQRLDRLPAGASPTSALLPELLDSRTRLGLLKEVMSGVGHQPIDTNLQGRFGQLENEWSQVEKIMKSDKDLSTSELLGLQARLYQVSQHIEVLSKVVDQVTGGVKTILNTNI